MNYKNLLDEEIYLKGKNDPTFDFNKGLDALIEKDKTGGYIYWAGSRWKTFDFKKGLDALIEIDTTGDYIYWSGREWKTFDFKKGLKHLLKIKSRYLQHALNCWKFPEEKLSNEEVLEFINLI